MYNKICGWLHVHQIDLCKRLITVLVAVITIVACTKPMDALPLWNGEIPDHRNQYELMAENILQGRIDFAYGDEDTLSDLTNPYDPDERREAGVRYHWDHAYYNGHYYMYFGIVPVFLAFLPYRIITGEPLTTYKGTQLFTAVFIAGIFALFALLRNRFWKKLPYGVYLAMAVAMSVMSVWYAAAEPALYCTAITAALALEIWSLYFFVRGVYVEQRENHQLFCAGIGALLGALTFGCRPTIALANILVIPMLIAFLQQRKFSWKLAGKLVVAALPYVVVAAALMTYNYVRFDDPFEFGQKYQLTVADQSQYRVVLDGPTRLRIWNDTMDNFFRIEQIEDTFPYIKAGSVLGNFPILLLCIALLKQSVRTELKANKLHLLTAGLFVAALLITAMDIVWTPYLLERYRMDIYFLLGIGCFMAVGMWHHCSEAKRQKYLQSAVVILCVLTVASAFLLCVQTIGNHYPNKVTEIAEVLHLQ